MSEAADHSPKSLKELVGLLKESQKPSTYYRHARPELFSDSEASKTVVLTKPCWNSNLTNSRQTKKEQEFEEFCRRLAEREICPNLVPQTARLAGGDSKVDSATYPVAGELAEHRYWGGTARPADEDWAFAFSAKKDWRTKVREDVAKVVALPRKFRQVFFVTNQPARDKVRAQIEAELTASSGMRVTILDRTWIVAKVLGNKLEELAVACLGLDVGLREERKRGPAILSGSNIWKVC
jgi:hypothetical protein